MADIDISSQAPSVVFFWDAEDIDIILARFPGPVAISPSRYAWSDRTRLTSRLGCGLGIVVFAVPGVVLAINAIAVGSWEGAILAAVEVGFCLFFAALILRMRRLPFLVLDQHGFTVKNAKIYQSCRWADVRDFRLGGILRWPRIRFKNSLPSARRRVILGLGEDWLKFLIPYRDKALASLMNRWRGQALAATGTNGPKHDVGRQ
jgi:hypothetical protein